MLTLRTLGGLGVDGPDPDAPATGRRPLALLALLAAAGERGMTRDRLIAFLWPESDDERGRNSLSQALTSLRRDLECEDLVVGTVELRLNSAVITSDVAEFERLADAGRDEEAAVAYAGRFLDGVHVRGSSELEQWVEEQRSRLHMRYVDALGRLAIAAAVRADHSSTVRWCRDGVRADPLNSGAVQRLMEALVAAGDTAGALQAFNAHEALLRAELEIEPDAALVARAASLRAARSGNGLPASAGSARGAASSAPGGPFGFSARQEGRRAWWRSPVAVGGILITVAVAGVMALSAARDAPVVVTTVTPLTHGLDALHLDASISPDGRYVAYSAGPMGRMRIFIQAADGSAPRQITDSANVPRTPRLGGDHRWPRWSPDGLTIAFEAGRGIRLVSANGGATRVLVDTGVKAAWSPSGKELVFADGGELRIVRLDSGIVRRLGVRTGVAGGTAVWSRDGKRIAFVRGGSALYVGGSTARNFGETSKGSVWIVGADGRDERQVTPETHLSASPAWGHDDRSVFFVSDRDGVRDIYRQRLERDGTLRDSAERVTTGAEVHTLTVSADGNDLAYSTARKHSDIWSVPITPGETPFSLARQVTRERQTMEYFAISHDRKWLAFDSDRDGRHHLFKVRLDGTRTAGEVVRLTSDSLADDFAPRWSPDDSAIVFHRIVNGVRDIWVVSSDGGHLAQVTRDSLQDYDPDWSPDGRHVVYRARVNLTINQAVFIVDRGRDGSWSAPRPVPGRGRQGIGQTVRWSPDGATLGGGGGLLAVKGGDAVALADRKALDGFPRFFAWGPDARSVYFMTMDSVNSASYWKAEVSSGQKRPGGVRRLLHLTDPRHPVAGTQFDTDGRSLFFNIRADEADVFVAKLRRR